MAEREGFEPSIRFWRILTFQASAFDHSATAPHALEGLRPSGMGGVSQARAAWHYPAMNPMLFAAMLAAAPATPTAQPPVNGAALAAVAPGPGEIVAKAPLADWVTIAPQDLLVMDLAPDAKGKPRRVVIQLMPAPFSQSWVGNIRKLAATHWWDGLAVTRVQDNYVAQWGDPASDDPAKARKLPEGLAVVGEGEYATPVDAITEAETAARSAQSVGEFLAKVSAEKAALDRNGEIALAGTRTPTAPNGWHERDSYAAWVEIHHGWPLAAQRTEPGTNFWPVHCYGMVGVGRNLSPDTGSGAELYTVIGHAPRHLDRNIALVGRVIEGIEHLSSLPRGHGPLGVYNPALGDELVPIRTIRAGAEVSGLPAYQYLSTESASFARYAEARANRHDAFFIRPAGGADICNIPVPVRRAP